MEEVDIKLTKQEAEVLLEYISRKCYRLEESGLTDSYCYPKLAGAKFKISRSLKEHEAE